jgi:NAD+ diphosphatase
MSPAAGHAADRPNTFVDFTLDRAAEFREDAAWLAAHEAAPDARFVGLDADHRIPVDPPSGTICWLDAKARARRFADAPASLLGVRAGHPWFLLPPTVDMRQAFTDAGASWISLREAGAILHPFDAGLAAYASALIQWQSVTRFCATCGGALEPAASGHRARCINPECGRLHFPRTDPAIIVIVEHAGACLLGRQASWPVGRYSTLAGFVEAGESLEAAVRREVAEETGVEVASCHYHSSQPWPFPASLMLGFTARARDRDIILRDGELEDARWFTPQDIVAGVREGSLRLSSPVSVSWHLLADWMRERADIDLAPLG